MTKRRLQIRHILTRMRLTTLFALLTTATLAASDAYPPPRFTDPDRVAKAVGAYTARYRPPRENPARVAIEIRVERVLGRVGQGPPA